MRRLFRAHGALPVVVAFLTASVGAQQTATPIAFSARDVFDLEWVTDQDYRAPSSEAEQFYAALKLRRVPAAMLRIPDASHSIDAKGSNLIAQAMYTIGWFDKYWGK